jgi:hypothetical protein
LTPAQQASVNAYNNGSINQPKKQNAFAKIVKSFGIVGLIVLIAIVVIIIVLIVVLVIYLLKKKKPPKNAYINQGGRLVPANAPPPTPKLPATTNVPVRR